MEGSSRKGRPQLGRRAKAVRSGDPHHEGAGSVRGPGSAQRQVSGLCVPPTHLVHLVETWASPHPSRVWRTRVRSSLSSLAARLRSGGSRHLGGEALCFCKLCALPVSWTPVLGLRPLPASHRAGGHVFLVASRSEWTDPKNRWSSAVSQLLRPLRPAAPRGGLREREARPPPVLWVSPLFVVPGGEAGLLVLGLVGGGRPRASLPSWLSPGPSRRRCHRETPCSPSPAGHVAAGCCGAPHVGVQVGFAEGSGVLLESLPFTHLEAPVWEWGASQGTPASWVGERGWG